MKSTVKKILAVALVLMMTLPLVAFPASADAYDEAEDGALLYELNFNEYELKGAWDGMKYLTPSEDGTSVELKAGGGTKGVTEGKVDADLPGFSIAGKAYTVVFTLDAERADQEIGFLPDDKVGFIIVPGENSYRFVNTNGEDGTDTVIEEGTYEGVEVGTLPQTYAIQFASEGEGEDAKIVAYNLCVQIDGEWVLVCEIAEDVLADIPFDWFYNYEEDGEVLFEDDFSIRFYRNRKARNTVNEKMIYVSDFKIYKGMIDAIKAETGGNTDGGNTDGGNTDGGNTDGGNDSANTEAGAPETNAPETEGETEETKNGCGGSLAMTGVALVGACAAVLAIKRRKNEDD